MKFILAEEVKGKFDSEEDFWSALKQGWEVEKEHAESVDNCPIIVARIALDHLSEDIGYYKKLKKMEQGDKPKEDEKETEKSEDKDKDEKEEEKSEDKEDKEESMKV